MNMDRAIFELNASVEATSLYILLCALMDQGRSPTLEEAGAKWAGTEESLLSAAQELIERCVLISMVPIPRNQHLHPTTRDRWC
ncbi:MAG: hypothetical protein AAGU11_00030 [Syntrophobacteraceae bacterium]